MYTGKFAPPAPGPWELETAHFQRPLSRWMASVFPPAAMRGFSEALARYGQLLGGLDIAVVEGFVYGCLRPVGAPKGAQGPPPKMLFKLLLLLQRRRHPRHRRPRR